MQKARQGDGRPLPRVVPGQDPGSSGLQPPCDIGSLSASAGVDDALALCRVLDWILGRSPSHADVAHRGT